MAIKRILIAMTILVIPLLAQEQEEGLIVHEGETKEVTVGDSLSPDQMMEKISQSRNYEPVNLSSVNSGMGDFAPYIDLSGEKLYISSSREGGEGGDDIWFSVKKTNRWSKPQNLGPPINSRYNEGSISFTPDGRTAFFTVCGRPDSYGGCDIYWTTMDDQGQWERPKNLGNQINSPGWDGHPNVSADGRWLYFSSERYGGFGSRDLYRAPLTEEGPQKAQNLGFPVNNARDQVSPSIHPDGKTLYFASSGHGGIGGLDVMKTTLDDLGKFTEPKRLLPPVNTEGNDYFFAIPASGELIYFASSRDGGYGGTDIYTYPLDAEMRPDVVATLRGKVVDKTTGEPIEAEVRVEDIITGEVLFNQSTDPVTGEFIVVLPAGRRYGISVSADDHIFTSTNYEVIAKEGYQKIDHTFELSRVQRGESITLNNLFFYFDKAELKPESFSELDRVVEIMKKYADMSIEIKGYTDTIGVADYNQWLSDERAKAVKAYLVDKLIPEARIKATGYGETQSETFRQARRVEFEILDVTPVTPKQRQSPEKQPEMIEETEPQTDEERAPVSKPGDRRKNIGTQTIPQKQE